MDELPPPPTPTLPHHKLSFWSALGNPLNGKPVKPPTKSKTLDPSCLPKKPAAFQTSEFLESQSSGSQVNARRTSLSETPCEYIDTTPSVLVNELEEETVCTPSLQIRASENVVLRHGLCLWLPVSISNLPGGFNTFWIGRTTQSLAEK